MRGNRVFGLAVILIISFTIVCFLCNTSVAQEFQYPFAEFNYLMPSMGERLYNFTSQWPLADPRPTPINYMPINNMWGITNASIMDYPWANRYQSGWGNMLGMMTNVDAYSGYSDWEDGGGYNMMDWTNIMNQSRDYMDMMNQFSYCSGCYIPPHGQAHIDVGPDRIILPKVSDPRWPSPLPMPEGNWPGTYASAPIGGLWGNY